MFIKLFANLVLEKMKLKEKPEDFLVTENYDLKKFEEKQEDKRYFYLILEKRNYNQIRALKVLKKIFRIGKKNLHFAGTKDKNAVTRQVISVLTREDEDRVKQRIDFVNEKIKDISLEFLGVYNGRINLGDLKSNHFDIVLRDLNLEDVERVKKNYEEFKGCGFINYFDSQRFGFANNSHIVGEYLVKQRVKDAIVEIFTSLPSNPTEDLRSFVDSFPRDLDIDVLKQIKEFPKPLREYVSVVEHLKKYPNDYLGAFRNIHKKIRTLYVNALQSYVWNLLAKRLEGVESENIDIPLVGFETDVESFKYHELLVEILDELKLCKEDFKIDSMPELSSRGHFRKFRLYPENLVIDECESDEVFEGKLKLRVSFDLESGAYATNIVKILFGEL